MRRKADSSPGYSSLHETDRQWEGTIQSLIPTYKQPFPPNLRYINGATRCPSGESRSDFGRGGIEEGRTCD